MSESQLNEKIEKLVVATPLLKVTFYGSKLHGYFIYVYDSFQYFYDKIYNYFEINMFNGYNSVRNIHDVCNAFRVTIFIL